MGGMIQRKIEIIEGVVAEYNGKYWGTQYQDSHSTENDFGHWEKADISNPNYCKTPTDKTWCQKNNELNPEYNKLKNARLVKVRKTITTEFEIIKFISNE